MKWAISIFYDLLNKNKYEVLDSFHYLSNLGGEKWLDMFANTDYVCFSYIILLVYPPELQSF